VSAHTQLRDKTLQQVRGRAEQPRYRTPIGKPVEGRDRRVLQRIGHNPETGLGQYPTPAGVLGAVRRIKGHLVEMRVLGQPAWDTSRNTSSEPDEAGRLWVTFKVNRVELEAELRAQGASFTLGHRGPSPAMDDVVAHVGGYNFQGIWTVEVGPV
jgi:hypothetical protein